MRRKTGYIKCDWLKWDFALMSLPETNVIVDGEHTLHKWDHVEIYLDGVTEQDEKIIEEFKKGKRNIVAYTDDNGTWELKSACVSSHRGTVVTIEFSHASRVDIKG